MPTFNIVREFYEVKDGVEKFVQKGTTDLTEEKAVRKLDIGLLDRHLEAPTIGEFSIPEVKFGEYLEFDPLLSGDGLVAESKNPMTFVWKFQGQVVGTDKTLYFLVPVTGKFQVELYATNSVGETQAVFEFDSLVTATLAEPVTDAEAGTVTYTLTGGGIEPLNITWYVDGKMQSEKSNVLVLATADDGVVTFEVVDANGVSYIEPEHEPEPESEPEPEPEPEPDPEPTP